MVCDPRSQLTFLFLHEALGRVIDDFKKRGEHGVDISQADPYWALDVKDIMNVYQEPTPPFGVGSLDDDLSELAALMRDTERLAIPADIERVANVLRVVVALLEEKRAGSAASV